MKILTSLLLITTFAVSSFAVDIKSGDDLVAAMYKKYEGKWYKTLSFVQKTIHHQPDGTTTSEMWHEAMSVPGNLRIDFVESKTGDGILFADGKLYSYRDGKPPTPRPFVHPLLVLGFDVYMQPVATTIAQIRGLGIDMSVVHEDTWQGKPAYVVGAKQGDVTTPQFWVDKKTMLFVRLIQVGGRDKKQIQETQFNKYVRSGGGWVSAEVAFFTDGKPTTTEEYSEIQSGMKLSPDLWNPDKWESADRTYWKKK